MSTRYECIKTYSRPLRFHGARCPDGSDPVWDEGLGQVFCPKGARSYAEPAADDAKPATAYDKAGIELDKLARELMSKRPETTYRAAFSEVLAANPTLKAAYGGTK